MVDAAAVRAAKLIAAEGGWCDDGVEVSSDANTISIEYKPLTDVVRRAPDFGGAPKTAFGHEYRAWLKELRAAMLLVNGE